MNENLNKDLIQNRAANAVRNTFFGIIDAILNVAFPFIIRTVIIRVLGDEYLGLNSFFLSVLQMLSLSELGIGTAMVYFLYEPAAHNDIKRVNALLSFHKKIYYVIAMVIALAGVVITPFLPRLVGGDLPDGENIYLLFILYLISTVVGYLIHPEEVALATAYQRGDINSKISLVMRSLIYGMQLAVLLLAKSFFLYLVVYLILCIVYGIVRGVVQKKEFPFAKSKGQVSAEERGEIKKRVLSMLGHQLDEKLLNSIDNIFVSSILGLSAVAIYGNYILVVTGVTSIMIIFFTSATSSIGNAIVTESKESNYERFHTIFWLNAVLGGLGIACLVCLYQDFMKLWMGDRIYGNAMVWLFSIYFYFCIIRQTGLTFKNAAGMWYNDRYKPYISVGVDLLLDIILIPQIGVLGAILSSCVCISIIEIPWETVVLFRDYFNGGLVKYGLEFFLYSALNLSITIILYKFCEGIGMMLSSQAVGLFPQMIIKLVVCISFFLFVYGIIFHKSQTYKVWCHMVKQTLMNVFKLDRKVREK